MVCSFCRGTSEAGCCLADSQGDLDTMTVGCLGMSEELHDRQLEREALMDRLVSEVVLDSWLVSWPLKAGVACSLHCFSRNPMTMNHCRHQGQDCACILLSFHLWL